LGQTAMLAYHYQGNQAIDFLDKIVFGERNKHQTAVSF
jgi:hypothetical protein